MAAVKFAASPIRRCGSESGDRRRRPSSRNPRVVCPDWRMDRPALLSTRPGGRRRRRGIRQTNNLWRYLRKRCRVDGRGRTRELAWAGGRGFCRPTWPRCLWSINLASLPLKPSSARARECLHRKYRRAAVRIKYIIRPNNTLRSSVVRTQILKSR